RAAAELFLERGLCFREMGRLVFPSHVSQAPPSEEGLSCEVSYRIAGNLEMLYASLVVCMSLTGIFRLERYFRNEAEFSSRGRRLGFALSGDLSTGTAELDVRF